MLRRLYDWVLHWAETPYGTPALICLSFAESSFFPIPPDVLLIALAISIPSRSFYYALVCSIASVMGGLLGYLIGFALMESVGWPIVHLYGLEGTYRELATTFHAYDFWAILAAALTPIPYKVFTIAAGAVSCELTTFVLASILGRSARFFAVGTLIYLFGRPVRAFIDRYFNLLAWAFMALLILGFVVIKYLKG